MKNAESFHFKTLCCCSRGEDMVCSGMLQSAGAGEDGKKPFLRVFCCNIGKGLNRLQSHWTHPIIPPVLQTAQRFSSKHPFQHT